MPRKVAREDILLKAAELFAVKDYHTVQMDDVACATGVAKGTLYNHFQSKDQLYAAILQQRYLLLAGELESASGQSLDPWENLRGFLIRWESFMLGHPHFFRMMRKSEPLLDTIVDAEGRKVRDRIRSILCRLLAEGASQGAFREVESGELCDAILGMAEGCVRAALQNGRNGRKCGEAVLGLLQSGLLTEEGGRQAS